MTDGGWLDFECTYSGLVPGLRYVLFALYFVGAVEYEAY